MRFRSIEEHRSELSAARQCQWPACKSKPSRQLQAASDMITLAHIKEQFPRMTEELKDIGLDIGHRRVGCFLLGDVNITCQVLGR